MSDERLLSVTLGLAGNAGAVADVVKKHIFHDHPMDWQALITLTEAVRIEAANVALIAERMIEQAQEADGG